MRAARQADADKRRLIAHGNALVEEERRRISMEIHDDLNAALVSVGLEAAALAAKASTDGRAEIRDGAERIAAVTDKLYARARDIGKRLRPEVIDALGLPGAVDEIVRYYDELHPACHFELHVDPQLPAVPERVAIAAYRIVQEALSNVVKHAQASRCWVSIEPMELTEGIRVTVKDDGKGFDVDDTASAGIGIIGMRERVAALGGSVVIEAGASRGTIVIIELPLNA